MLLKYEVGWLMAIFLSTVVGGSLFSTLIGGVKGKSEIDGLPPRFIPEVWLVAAVFFALLWAALTLLNIEIH